MYMKYIYSIVFILISLPVFSQNKEYNFKFFPESEVFSLGYMDNNLEFPAMDGAIRYSNADILSGQAHIALISDIKTGEGNDPAAINRASIVGNVLKSYLKTTYKLSNEHFTFHFDDSNNIDDRVRVVIMNRPIKEGENREIYYTRSDRLRIVLDQYKVVPMVNYVGANRQAIAEVVPGSVVETSGVSERDLGAKIGGALENKIEEVAALTTEKKRRSKSIIKFSYFPRFAVKTNLLYWVGYTPFSYEGFFNMEPAPTALRNMLPNIEIEYYFGGKISVAAEVAYMKHNYSEEKWWKVSSYSLEPRFWLGGKDLYKGVFVGLFGQAGDFDINEEFDINNNGYTGTYYGGGLSLGYLLPIYRGFAVEVGVKGGYQIVNRDQYVLAPNGDYTFFGRDRIDGFRLLGANISLMYRFRSK